MNRTIQKKIFLIHYLVNWRHRFFVKLQYRIAIRAGGMEFSLNLSCSKRSKLKNSTLVGTIKLRTRGRLENGKRKREERCISFRVSSQRESLEIKQRLDLLPWKFVHSNPSFRYERYETFLSLYRRVKEEFWM